MVTEALSVASEKVTEMFELIETEVSESAGEVEETVGAVVSTVVTVVNPLEVLYRLLRVFLVLSVTPVVTVEGSVKTIICCPYPQRLQVNGIPLRMGN